MFLLKLLGTLSLHGEALPVPPGAQQKRRLELLALLAIGGDKGISRDRLQAYLWPERPSARSRHALDQLIYAVRRSLGFNPIVSGAKDLRLDPALIGTDIRLFEAALPARQWAEAVQAYGGPLLHGFHLSGSRELESWIDAERSRLEHQYHLALETLAREATAEADNAAAVSWWRMLAASDPLSSRVAAGMIDALARAGDRSGAIIYARNYQQRVKEELEVEADPVIGQLVASLARPPLMRPAAPDPVPGTTSGESVTAPASRDVTRPSAEGAKTAAESEGGNVTPSSSPARTTNVTRRRAVAGSLALAAIFGTFIVYQKAGGEDSHESSPPLDARTRPVDQEAKALYLRGISSWNDRSMDALDTAVVYFRHALELDPIYPEAYAGLASAYAMIGYSGYRPAGAMFPKAREAALRSIELDSTLAAPYAALGMELTWQRNFVRAEEAFRNAISLDPKHATAHQWYGILHMILGRKTEAVAELARAAELDALSLQIQNNYATFLAAAGQSDAARRHYQKMIEEEPDSAWVARNPWLLTNMSSLYAARGQVERGIEIAKRAVDILPRHPRALGNLAGIYHRSGRTKLAQETFSRADTANEHYAAYRALYHAQAGEQDSAVVWFNRVQEWGVPIMISIQANESVGRLRGDPRFIALLDRLGLPVPR